MVDLAIATTIFNTLYHDVNGYLVSSQARNNLPYHDKAHTYGEITPESFERILKKVEPKKGEVFYDLGSGTGKAVILAALLAPFSKCIGVEILKELHDSANGVCARFESDAREQTNTQTAIEFLQGDFLRIPLSDADVIFTHSTCFYDELWAKLVNKFITELKPGTRVVTVTKTITSPEFAHMDMVEMQMGWGKATVHFYQKV